MTKYIIKRILIAIPVLLGITVIDYAIMCMAVSYTHLDVYKRQLQHRQFRLKFVSMKTL